MFGTIFTSNPTSNLTHVILTVPVERTVKVGRVSVSEKPQEGSMEETYLWEGRDKVSLGFSFKL